MEKSATCKAIVVHDRIQLDVRKGDEGYDKFASVLSKMEKNGHMSWYGDICRKNGSETSGLVITNKGFKEWLTKEESKQNETSTSTGDVAGFARHVFSSPVRRQWLGPWAVEDPFFKKKKKKKS